MENGDGRTRDTAHRATEAHGNASADAGTGNRETHRAPYLVGRIASGTLEAFIDSARKRCGVRRGIQLQPRTVGPDVLSFKMQADARPIIADVLLGRRNRSNK